MQEQNPRLRDSWLWLPAAGLKALASMPLAVAILGLYAAVLVWATMIESHQGAPAAHRTVYHAPWFTALGVLLAVNVLCAVLVRLPWRRRQTGFVITHAGILVLLAGCLVTRLWGVEAQLSVVEGDASHTARQIDVTSEDSLRLDLGFQVFLRQFRRKLDPGSGMASHYSSRVDFLDLSKPPKKLRENVLITLNAPVDFTDPRSGRTYRLFQSSFEGPWLPGDPEFDQLVGNDHSRDQVYLSVLSVNYDPGRGLKYAGCLMVVVGIGVVYYSRRFGKKGSGFRVQDSGDRT